MEARTEEIVQQSLRQVYEFAASDDDREKNADQRAEAIIKAIHDGQKRQAEALERGLREIAAALELAFQQRAAAIVGEPVRRRAERATARTAGARGR